MVFEPKEGLTQIERNFQKVIFEIASEKTLDLELDCFVCYNVDERDVSQWLESRFVPDLERVGIRPVFSLWNLNYGNNLDSFQELARNAELVVVVCTPGLREKCESRRENPRGVAQEIAVIKGRFGDQEKHGRIFPIFLKGSRKNSLPSAYFEGIFGVKFSLSKISANNLEYYLSAIELLSAMKNIPRRLARMYREKFLSQVRIETSQEKKVQIPCNFSNKFAGRKKELSELNKILISKNRVAISGLGGIGKTALAQKFVIEKFSESRSAFFIRSYVIEEDLLKLADQLNISSGRPLERIEFLGRKLEREQQVVVIDEVDTEEKFKKIEVFFSEKKCKILITTRKPNTSNLYNYHVYRLKELKLKDAIALLGHHKTLQKKELANKLGRLPLALLHAKRYIDSTQIEISEYLRLLDIWKWDLFQNKNLDLRETENTVLSTWSVSVDRINNYHKDELAKEILSFFSFFADVPIPLNLIYMWAEKYHPEATELMVLNSMRILSDYSLVIAAKPGNYEIHALVKSVSKYTLGQEMRVRKLKEVSYFFLTQIEKHNMQLNRARALIESAIPHVEMVLKYIGDEKQTFSDFNELFYELSRQYFYFLYHEGKYRQALENEKRLLEHLRTFSENVESLPDLDTLRLRFSNVTRTPQSLNNMGMVLRLLGFFKEAISYHKASLQLTEKIFGEKHPDLSICLTHLGDNYLALGKKKKAYDFQIRALKLRKTLYGENHLDVAQSFSKVGNVLLVQGELKQALEYQEKAEKIIDAISGKKCLQAALVKEKQGRVLSKLGEGRRAINLQKEALKILRKNLGNFHPEVMHCMNGIASTFEELGEEREAELFRLKALDLTEKKMKDFFPEWITKLKELGWK